MCLQGNEDRVLYGCLICLRGSCCLLWLEPAAGVQLRELLRPCFITSLTAFRENFLSVLPVKLCVVKRLLFKKKVKIM